MYTADLVLHTNCVIRADLIDFSTESYSLSAYEYDRKFSKGHAKFWGIKARDIRWETSSSIRFILKVESSDTEFIRPATFDEVSLMIENGEISPTGEAFVGEQEAQIVRVEVGRSNHSFEEFYQRYIMLQEDVNLHVDFFSSIVEPGHVLAFDPARIGRYDYEEDIKMLYECADPDHHDLKKKDHHHFTLCYFTEAYPGIRPLPLITNELHKAIFRRKRADILHVGEPLSTSPVEIGKLCIYNEIDIEEDSLNFVNDLIKKTSDYSSNKGKMVLSAIISRYLKHCIGNQHFPIIFDFVFRDYILPKMTGEFSKDGMIVKEAEIEFKSKDAFAGKTSKFVKNTLIPTLKKYVDGKELKRLCILYGIEDDGSVNSISNLPSDRITDLEEGTNRALSKEWYKIEAHGIKASGGSVLMIIILPK
jgi:hypothetical protein